VQEGDPLAHARQSVAGVRAGSAASRAWLKLVDVAPGRTPFPWTSGGAWTVYAVWALAATALAIAAVHRRDQ
jgi:hypothetical protein